MSDILKGNFTPKNKVSVDESKETLETRFEKAALKRLGGSIAFVSKQKVVWEDEEEAADKKAE